jgi:hypothetical protein
MRVCSCSFNLDPAVSNAMLQKFRALVIDEINREESEADLSPFLLQCF